MHVRSRKRARQTRPPTKSTSHGVDSAMAMNRCIYIYICIRVSNIHMHIVSLVVISDDHVS